jgi:hypothetical protein
METKKYVNMATNQLWKSLMNKELLYFIYGTAEGRGAYFIEYCYGKASGTGAKYEDIFPTLGGVYHTGGWGGGIQSEDGDGNFQIPWHNQWNMQSDNPEKNKTIVKSLLPEDYDKKAIYGT